MIEPVDADATALALRMAASAAKVRQIAYEMGARADEWSRAVKLYEELDAQGDEAVIELVGSVGRGMKTYHDRFGWCRVLRKLARGDEVALHMDSPDNPNGWYLNFMDNTSPVVVKA